MHRTREGGATSCIGHERGEDKQGTEETEDDWKGFDEVEFDKDVKRCALMKPDGCHCTLHLLRGSTRRTCISQHMRTVALRGITLLFLLLVQVAAQDIITQMEEALVPHHWCVR